MVSGYDVTVDAAVEWIDRNGHRRIVLQLPEGLKREALWISRSIEKATGAEVMVSGDPCFGACDVPADMFRGLGFDAVLHLGHGDLGLDAGIPTLHVPVSSVSLPGEALEKVAGILKEGGHERVMVVTTVQHTDRVMDVCSFLEDKGLDVVRGDDIGCHVVLGCDVEAAANKKEDVDAFVAFVSGEFHAMGVAAVTAKPVIAVDPMTGRIEKILDRGEVLMRKRHAMIALAKDAKVFGILASSKSGQARIPLARRLRDEVRSREGLDAYISVMDLITPTTVLSLPGDAFVSTACPRIALDDSGNYDRPLLTPDELETVIGARDWKDFRLDQMPRKRRV